jgi:hypothetical protein
LVLTATGSAAGPNYQVTATRVADKLLTTRNAVTTPTDGGGMFHLVADPGLYRVEIVPPASTGLPRKLVSIELPQDASGAESTLPSISLSPPLSVVGTIAGRLSPGASDTRVIGATVSFFALDASGQHSVFLGSALTDQSGQFKAVLPDVQNPGP